MYTVTGWGDSSVPPFEVNSFMGRICRCSMGEHVGKEYQPGSFLFDSFRDNENIGNDQIKRQDVCI